MTKDFIVFYKASSGWKYRQCSLAIRINLAAGTTLEVIHQALLDRISIDHELKFKEKLLQFEVTALTEIS